MASVGFLALLDDIATLLDDVSLMTKVAAKKTVGVLGDDLALNAEQVSGVNASRELPVVWAVTKGSLLNKVILVPLALLISAFLPWLVTPLLMLGGLFLCFEGVEKVTHQWLHKADEDTKHHEQLVEAVSQTDVDIAAYEKAKIKGAIRTDFILSAEIIVIALGATQNTDWFTQSIVMSLIAVLITLGVYGLVAAIVKFDDVGLALINSATPSTWGNIKLTMGRGILWLAPKFMHLLSNLGMVAMFLVGGGILVHGLPFLHHVMDMTENMNSILSAIFPLLFNIIIGLIAGTVLLTAWTMIERLKPAAKG